MNHFPESNLLTPATSTRGPLSPELMHRIDAYWRAANHLSVGQIYLYDNPLLKRPLELSDVKPLIVGHWARLRARISSTCAEPGDQGI
jgi:phosphoketolase